MDHWILVGKDIWSVARWILPPALFCMVGMISHCLDDRESGGAAATVILVFTVLGYIGYVATVNGWWM